MGLGEWIRYPHSEHSHRASLFTSHHTELLTGTLLRILFPVKVTDSREKKTSQVYWQKNKTYWKEEGLK
jgi:hypothetical protein